MWQILLLWTLAFGAEMFGGLSTTWGWVEGLYATCWIWWVEKFDVLFPGRTRADVKSNETSARRLWFEAVFWLGVSSERSIFVISMMSLFFRAVGIPLSFFPTKLAKIVSESSELGFESAWKASQARSKASQFVVRLIARRFGFGFSEMLIIINK